MTIGLLFPRSDVYPLIGAEFLEGIKTQLALNENANKINFISESIGFGGVEKEVYGKTEKLLMMDNVDLLIAFMDEKILELIKPLILAANRICIIVNTGANYPINWVAQPNIIHLTLQHSFLCAVIGSTAAQGQKQKEAALCSSFYDCGYMHLLSMVNEFVNGSGIIKHNYINKQTLKEELVFPELIQFLNDNKSVKTLLSIYDSKIASAFYKQLKDWSQAGTLEVYVSPMMLEEKALQSHQDGFPFSVEGYVPWHSSAPGNANTTFISTYQKNFQKVPYMFSLLGWETGLILQAIIDTKDVNYRNAEEVIVGLLSKKIASPRGEMILDEETLYYLTPAIRCFSTPGANELKREYGIDLQSEWEEFSAKNIEGNIAGWTNTYLCY
jgi:branched-chain amino acid transport system substrate-binding protein